MTTTQQQPHGFDQELSGTRVLLVEDDELITALLVDIFDDHGIEIVGPAATLAHALEVAESGSFDVAMLDVNLGCETSFPVARVLRERGIPFFYTTAFANTAHPDIAGEVFLPKPYGIKDLLETLRQVLPARSKRDS